MKERPAHFRIHFSTTMKIQITLTDTPDGGFDADFVRDPKATDGELQQSAAFRAANLIRQTLNLFFSGEVIEVNGKPVSKS